MAPKTPPPAPSRGPVVLGALVFVGVVVLAVRAHDEALRSPRFTVEPAVARVAQRPEWLPADLAASLATHLGERLAEPISLAESDSLRAWEPALADDPWVRGVTLLEPRFPGRVRARLDLRRPMLQLGDGSLAADDGRLLGRGEVAMEPPLLRLTGPSSPADVRACALAATELLPHRELLDDWGVLVDEVESLGGGRVVFRDARGLILDWGRARGSSEFAEVDLDPEAKIQNLQRALVAKPGLVGIARVELWRAEPLLHPARG